MRKVLVIALSLGWLVACNRPAEAPETDVLATSVAATLTAQPSGDPTFTQPAPARPTLTPSVTAVPTTTLIPSETAESTEPPEPTSTLTATAPAIPADDPRFGLDLSNPEIHDDFSQRFIWFEFDEEDSATIVWEDGRLRATDNLADGFLWWSTAGIERSNSYVEVTAEVGSCAGKDAYGMAVRVGGANFDQGYSLEVACDGTFRMRKFISESAPAILLNWTTSEHLLSGPDVTNVIGLAADGGDLYPVANGEPLLETPIQDSAYDSGLFSLFPSAGQTDGLTVYFDDFKVWTLSP